MNGREMISNTEPRQELPKRLAARIRAAQRKVLRAREAIAYGEVRIESSRSRIAEYELDPEAFAVRYYQRLPVDSYPVRTTIARERENLAYLIDKQPRRVEELEALESDLRDAECAVAAEAAAIRFSKGRVPVPEAPPPLESIRREYEAEWAQLDRENCNEVDRLLAEQIQQEADEAERRAAEDREFEQELALKLSGMPPDKAAKLEAQVRFLQNGFASGAFSFTHLINALSPVSRSACTKRE
ncbi:MAG: hypothetical protein M3372_08120 [Verrucomicrobiota bacterium]|nr:hypothetical protein [Verrucomicrobiota bacterium]